MAAARSSHSAACAREVSASVATSVGRTRSARRGDARQHSPPTAGPSVASVRISRSMHGRSPEACGARQPARIGLSGSLLGSSAGCAPSEPPRKRPWHPSRRRSNGSVPCKPGCQAAHRMCSASSRMAPQQHRPEGFGGSLRRNAAEEFGHGVQGSIVHSKQPAARRRTRELIKMHWRVALTLPLRASTRGVKLPGCTPGTPSSMPSVEPPYGSCRIYYSISAQSLGA